MFKFGTVAERKRDSSTTSASINQLFQSTAVWMGLEDISRPNLSVFISLLEIQDLLSPLDVYRRMFWLTQSIVKIQKESLEHYRWKTGSLSLRHKREHLTLCNVRVFYAFALVLQVLITCLCSCSNSSFFKSCLWFPVAHLSLKLGICKQF